MTNTPNIESSPVHDEDHIPLMADREFPNDYGSVEDSDGTVELDLHTVWTKDTNDSYSDDVLALPEVVRETVPLQDNPNVPVLTLRYFVLATLFVVPGAFIDTMNSFRTTSAPYSIFFVQIAAHWAGKWLARTMPKRRLKVLLLLIDLNPGPWSIKETAMVTITANSGATGNLATNAFALADLHFKESVSPWVALPFMWAIVFVGYSYAAIAKPYLITDTKFTFPKTLMKTALLKSQESSDGGGKQMKVFFILLSIMAVWQLFPEFIFPMTSSIAILCYMAPYNETVNFIGSGLGGMGVLNFSLDWANITSSIMLYPYWIQVIQFVGFVLGAYILIPLVKFSNLGFHKDGLMSNRLFTSDGHLYPTEKLLTSDLKFNSTTYEALGPVYLGSQRVWNMFFDYAAYVSGVVWVVLFGYSQFKSPFAARSTTPVFTDRLNKLHRKYTDVPTSWYITLFLVSFATLLTIFVNGNLFLEWKFMIVTLILGAIIVFPLSWLYALSNFQLAIGTFNELLYGYMVQNKTYKHPVSALIFGSIAGDAWYRAQYHLEVMKLGFYNHLPPKAVFFSQLYGELIGIPVNYIALKWVLKTKRRFLTGEQTDPLHQWTGQAITSAHSNAIQYVVLGPSRLFTNYAWLPYGFLLGIAGPFGIYWLALRFPHSKLQFNLWNTTVFFSTMSTFYGNISTGYLSRFIGGTVTMFYGLRYKHDLWKKYNYISAAALDTGYNLAVVVLFLFITMFPGITFPNWWGNDKDNIERCFALK